MRAEQIFFSLVCLILALSLFALGAFLFFIPFLPDIEKQVKLYLISHADHFSSIGIILMAIGCALVSLFGFLSRRRYILIQMGSVRIEENVIREIVKKDLQALFPGKRLDCDVIVNRKGEIEILANLPDIEEESLEKIERVLTSSLSECGIQREFLLNVRLP